MSTKTELPTTLTRTLASITPTSTAAPSHLPSKRIGQTTMTESRPRDTCAHGQTALKLLGHCLLPFGSRGDRASGAGNLLR